MNGINAIGKLVQRSIAVCLSFILLVTSVDLQAFASGESAASKPYYEEHTEIISFLELPENIANQNLLMGAKDSEIAFPNSLEATVETSTQYISNDSDITEDSSDISNEIDEENTSNDSDELNNDNDSPLEPSSDESQGDTPANESVDSEPKPSDTTETPAQPQPSDSSEAVDQVPVEDDSSTDSESSEERQSDAEDEIEAVDTSLVNNIKSYFAPFKVYASELQEEVEEEDIHPIEEELVEKDIHPIEEELVEETADESGVNSDGNEAKNTVERKNIVLDIEKWQIDESRSSDVTFRSDEGDLTFVYVPVFKDTYTLAEGVSLPTITVKIDVYTYRQSVTLNGITITVTAEEGVLPKNAILKAAIVADDSNESKAIESAVSKVREKTVEIGASYSFDIHLEDDEGNEIQPDTNKGKVHVAFTVEEADNDNLHASVYHLTEDRNKLEANKLSVERHENGTDEYHSDNADVDTVLVAETDGFSYYTVEFTYGELTYELQGNYEVNLQDVLAAIGISGEIEHAQSTAPDLFEVEKIAPYEEKSNITQVDSDLVSPSDEEEGTWVVRALKEFKTDEELNVVVDGVEYLVHVTDANGLPGARSYTDSKGNVFLGGNYIEVGLDPAGSFGTSQAAPSNPKFHTSVNQGNRLGLRSDGDGFDVGAGAVTGDFFLPGSPEERYILGYKMGGGFHL